MRCQGYFFKIALGTRVRNLYIMLKFTEPPKTLGVTLKKNVKKDMAFLEGNKLFVGDLVNLDETNADMVQFTKRWN